ncbi:hypothetical protein LTR62_003717 [Meristemomyces frigidus]|uniref:DUF427 domain-containing protein n=1 Tax=Meristemomyces frigidus TaxID=1508187 RepID=A0AAN7TJV1_9PEZI|nr:hypothetical protein LTR62_003717 [Meristemomyces frigidus]
MSDLKQLALKLAKDGPHKTLPTPRLVQLLFNGIYIAKTTEARYVWEHPYYPHFYIPLTSLHTTADHNPAFQISEGETYHSPAGEPVGTQLLLTVGARTLTKTISFPPHLPSGSPAATLAGLVKIDFDSIDQWFEESAPIFVHPKDPFIRVEILPSTRSLRVWIDGQQVATTTSSMHLYETLLPARFYLPLTDVDPTVLRRSGTRTKCPYKGEAEYYSVEVKGKLYEDVVWYYNSPTIESAQVRGLVCFYNERVDIELDGKMLERPSTHFGKASEDKKPAVL